MINYSTLEVMLYNLSYVQNNKCTTQKKKNINPIQVFISPQFSTNSETDQWENEENQKNKMENGAMYHKASSTQCGSLWVTWLDNYYHGSFYHDRFYSHMLIIRTMKEVIIN